MKRLVSICGAALLSVGLSGCLDLSMRGELQGDGSMTISTEIGVDKSVVTQIGQIQAPASKGKKASDEAVTAFTAMCKDGYDGVPEGMSPVPKKGSKKGKAADATATLPKPNGTVSERDGFLVCTVKQTFADPVKQYAEIAEKAGVKGSQGTLTPLVSGTGYRFQATFSGGEALRENGTMSEEERASVAMIAGMIPREMTTSVTIAGVRVENTNGTVSADGKSVTWKLPIHKLFDTRPGTEPIKMAADVYFK